jgi:hypothetical protein
MKYKNTLNHNIFAKIDGITTIVAPEQEIESNTPIPGLHVVEVISTPKPPSLKKQKSKTVKTNELTTTHKTKD